MATRKNLWFYTFIAVFGGLIVGLNMAGISGAIPFLKETFALTDLSLGLAVSILTIGCLAGALVGGRLSDRLGRRRILICSALLFTVTSLAAALTPGIIVLMAARFVTGLVVGMVSTVVPVYISEISPARLRGSLVSYNQLAVVVGILIAYVVDYLLLDVAGNWRWMLSVPFVFSTVYCALLTRLPESPRWLSLKGEKQRSREIISSLGLEPCEAAEITAADTADTPQEKVRVSELFRGRTFRIVMLGVILAALQQITGINVIINYAPTIFEQTGIGGDTALLQSILVGTVNLVFTILAVWIVDRVGRKTILVTGSAGMAAALGLLAYSFYFPSASSAVLMLAGILGFIAFFAASMAPLMWVVTSEIYPARIRGTAMALSTGVSWGCTFLTVQFFPWMLTNLGGGAVFSIFGIFSLVAVVFIGLCIPETRGKTLEQIEKELFQNPKDEK